MNFALLLSALFQLFGGSQHLPPPPDTSGVLTGARMKPADTSGVLTGARMKPADTSGVLTGRKPAKKERAMDTSGVLTG